MRPCEQKGRQFVLNGGISFRKKMAMSLLSRDQGLLLRSTSRPACVNRNQIQSIIDFRVNQRYNGCFFLVLASHNPLKIRGLIDRLEGRGSCNFRLGYGHDDVVTMQMSMNCCRQPQSSVACATFADLGPATLTGAVSSTVRWVAFGRIQS